MKGKILVCLHDGYEDAVLTGFQAASVGAVGLILANTKDEGNKTGPRPHVLPTSHVNFIDGNYIFTYINRTK